MIRLSVDVGGEMCETRALALLPKTYKILWLPLDLHNIREYFNHPMADFLPISKGRWEVALRSAP
jgi:hypothetical protein